MKLIKRLPPRVRFAIQLGTGAGMLVAMVFVYQPAKILAYVGQTNWLLALPAILGLVLVHLLQVEAWRFLSVRLTRLFLPWPFAVRTYYAGQAFGSLTPGNLGSDVYRVYAVSSDNAFRRKAIAPIVCQRLFSYTSLLLLCTALAPIAVSTAFEWRKASEVAAILIFSAIVFMTILSRLGVIRRTVTLLRRLWNRIADMLALEQRPELRKLLPALSLALLFHMASVLFAYVLILSLHQHVAFGATFGLLTFARLASLLPFTPYGLGLQEGALALILPTVGVSPEAAIAVSVLTRLALLLTVVVGISSLSSLKLGFLAGREAWSID